MRKIIFALLFVLTLASCSGKKGYSVLLWSIPDKQLSDGDVVPVYIKSNISHVYVIGLPQGGKYEVPLWQLTEPEFKFKAQKTAFRYKEYRRKYATVALDGLPMRLEPVNTAKQVYRLRKGENIKILYKGKGQQVMSGKRALEGDWLRVLTKDGTQGWCFSYNLRPYEIDRNGINLSAKDEEVPEEQTNILEPFLTKGWYPDYYRQMIDSKRIDLDKLNPDYRLILDSETQRLTFTMPKINEDWEYTGEEKTDLSTYKLKNIPIVITVKRSNYLVARYTGPSGKPEDFNLVTIDADIDELVQQEMERRESEYEKILNFGPSFQSQSYGSLVLSEDHSFEWNNYRLLVPSVIASSAKNKGLVTTKYFLNRSLQASYDGVITFLFDGMDREVNFLYKMEENGLRFEDAQGVVIKNNTVIERSKSPLVLFFNIGD